MDNRMSDEEIKNLRDLARTAVLSGNVTGDIWTGYPNSKFIDKLLIRDPKKLEEFKNKVKDLEIMIKTSRMTSFSLTNKEVLNISRKIADLIAEINKNLKYYELDKDAYLIYLIKTYEELKINNPDEIKNMPVSIKNYFDNITKAAIEGGKPIYSLVFLEDSNSYEVMVTTTIGKEKKLIYAQSEERLKEFVKLITNKEEITDEDILEVLNYFNIKISVSDVYTLVKDENFAEYIYESVFCNYLKDCGVPEEEIQNCLIEELIHKAEKEHKFIQQSAEIMSKYQSEYMLKYLKYIDVNKLILLYLYRSLESFERIECGINEHYEPSSTTEDLYLKSDDGENIERTMLLRGENVLEYMKAEKEILDKILKSRVINNYTKIVIFSNDGREQKITMDNIKELMKKFQDGIYIIPPVIEYLKQEIYFNVCSEYITPNIIRKLDFSKEELIYLSATNIYDLKKFYENGLIDKSVVLEIVNKLVNNQIPDLEELLSGKKWHESYGDIIRQTRVNPDLIEFINDLKNEELIDEKDIKTFYEDCYFELDDLEKINFDEGKFEELVTEEELLDAYKKYVNLLMKVSKVPSKEEKEELEKLRILKDRKLVLYKRFKLKDMTPEEQKENSENFILNYYADLDNENIDEYITESLVLMYKDGIIDLENIVNADETFLKNIIIERMLKRGELSLADTAKIRESIGLESIKKIVEEALDDRTIDENQKFILVMNMFYRTSKEDTTLRIKYLNRFRYESYKGELSGVQNGEIESNLELDSRSNNNSRSDKNYEIRMYPDNVKWIFFYSLDPDIQIKKFANGFVRVYSPKLQRYITEKYYEVDGRTHKIKSLAYGVATRNVEKNKYDMNRDRIEDVLPDGLEVLNEKELRKVSSKTECVRHNTRSIDKNWMRAMVSNLGINLEIDTRYTEQELDLLRRTIENYERMYITL